MRRCDRERVPWPRRHYEGDGDPLAGRAWVVHVNTSAGQRPPWRRRVIRAPGLLDHLRDRPLGYLRAVERDLRREPVALPGGGR